PSPAAPALARALASGRIGPCPKCPALSARWPAARRVSGVLSEPPAPDAPLDETAGSERAEALDGRVQVDSGRDRDRGGPAARPRRDRLENGGGHRVQAVPGTGGPAPPLLQALPDGRDMLDDVLGPGHAHRAPFPDDFVAAG